MTTQNMEEIRARVVDRVKHLAIAKKSLIDAIDAIDNAGGRIEEAWEGYGNTDEQQREWRRHKRQGIDALAVFAGIQAGDITEQLIAAVDQLAFLTARDVIAEVARTSDEPVVALTGNSYMPPLRDIAEAEIVWMLDEDGTLWEAFTEALERKLAEERITMGSPDYDNMLYVVDEQRWQLVSDDEDPNAWLDNNNWSALRH